MTFAAPAITPDTPEARAYNRTKRRLSIADLVLNFVFLIVLLATGWNGTLRDWALSLSNQGYSLGVFYYVVMLLVISKAIGFPLDFYSFRLEHQYQLSNQKTKSWLWDEAKGWLVGLVLGSIFVEIIYAMIRSFPERWWIVAWAFFIGIMLLLVRLAPVVLFPIFYKFKPLENDGLRDRLTRLGERAGTRVRGVYEWNLSEKSKKANAALMGMGATRRIILADTLLANYSDDEIEAVLAHELGHHVHKHILKGIITQVVITFFGFWLTNQVLHLVLARQWFPSLAPRLYDFANLPLILIVATVLSLLLMPAMNALSRKHEREADRYAWENIAAIEPFVTSMQKLADQNLAERTPNKVIEMLFHSHPSIGRRVAAAEEWARARQQA